MATPSTSASGPAPAPAPASSAFPLTAAARFLRVSAFSSTRAFALAERRRTPRCRLSEVGGGDRSVAAGRSPGPRSFHGLVLSGNAEGAMQSLRRELSSGVHPLHGNFVALVHVFAKNDLATRCMEILATMERQSIKRELESSRRRMLLAAGAAVFLSWPNLAANAAEAKKGFLPVTDKKDGYSFLYPFGWQEVVVQGQDKVYKDVIEPLESVSVNTIPTSKQDIRELGPPDQVAEALIRKVLAAPTQKTKLIEAKENDVDGRTYYTFEFTAQAPNFTRHALGAIAIANGKFYTLTTGANERRWEKIKDRLHTVVDSFKIEARV
uniref:PsbP family protein, expressed n=1 Tax=Oryza sativa subsp. japonica TaxID=39947 RepID=Q109K9_ORYSJ|nr:PsbP family protein, expressed [Oryza sativa Japonica Group]